MIKNIFFITLIIITCTLSAGNDDCITHAQLDLLKNDHEKTIGICLGELSSIHSNIVLDQQQILYKIRYFAHIHSYAQQRINVLSHYGNETLPQLSQLEKYEQDYLQKQCAQNK